MEPKRKPRNFLASLAMTAGLVSSVQAAPISLTGPIGLTATTITPSNFDLTLNASGSLYWDFGAMGGNPVFETLSVSGGSIYISDTAPTGFSGWPHTGNPSVTHDSGLGFQISGDVQLDTGTTTTFSNWTLDVDGGVYLWNLSALEANTIELYASDNVEIWTGTGTTSDGQDNTHAGTICAGPCDDPGVIDAGTITLSDTGLEIGGDLAVLSGEIVVTSATLPLPGALWLLACGLAGLGLFRTRG